MRQQEDQRERAEADLNAVRDLCVKLDQQKDNLMQQLGDKDSLELQVIVYCIPIKTNFHKILKNFVINKFINYRKIKEI